MSGRAWNTLLGCVLPLGAVSAGAQVLRVAELNTAQIGALDGGDPGQVQRYAEYLEKQPLYQGWIKAATAHDERLAAKERDWLRRKSH